MVTASKKTSSLDKVASSSVAKKSTVKKSAIETGASAGATAKTAVKKAVAKTPAVKAAVKKTVGKTIATPKAAAAEPKPTKAPVARKAAAKTHTVQVSPEHRYHMIATAAYFKAERRGFAGGYEMQDWISAEAEVDVQFTPQSHLGFTR